MYTKKKELTEDESVQEYSIISRQFQVEVIHDFAIIGTLKVLPYQYSPTDGELATRCVIFPY